MLPAIGFIIPGMNGPESVSLFLCKGDYDVIMVNWSTGELSSWPNNTDKQSNFRKRLTRYKKLLPNVDRRFVVSLLSIFSSHQWLRGVDSLSAEM